MWNLFSEYVNSVRWRGGARRSENKKINQQKVTSNNKFTNRGDKKSKSSLKRKRNHTSKSVSLRNRIESLAKQGQTVYKDIFRRANVGFFSLSMWQWSMICDLPSKVVRSSSFEAMLLKATWPSDAEVPSETITQIVKHSIPAFKYSRHVNTSTWCQLLKSFKFK